MTQCYYIKDDELGQVKVMVNPRAKRLTFRSKDSGLCVTVPVGCGKNELLNVMGKMRPRLLDQMQKYSRKMIDLSFQLKTPYFCLSFVEEPVDRFFVRKDTPGVIEVVCPRKTNFEEHCVQTWLSKVVEEILRERAQQILPLRLAQLARSRNFSFRTVKINRSKTRWGSCSADKNINLSLYVLTLPEALIDYVLLHELCHTVEMNHGHAFWALLDQSMFGSAMALRQDLKRYRTTF